MNVIVEMRSSMVVRRLLPVIVVVVVVWLVPVILRLFVVGRVA